MFLGYAYFNSIKVRLELNNGSLESLCDKDFNSIKVRLERKGTPQLYLGISISIP